MEEEETALSVTHLRLGYAATCEALGEQAELAETSLSTVGDDRWPATIAFQYKVQTGARLCQRTRSSGQRSVEEYGTPLCGSDVLGAPGVVDLVLAKGDGAVQQFQFMQLLASQQPLKQLEKMVPHGIRESKLFDALVQHKVPLPRALWLVKVMYLNRQKNSTSERLVLWTEDVCKFMVEMLKEGLHTRSFVSRGGEFHLGGGKQTDSGGQGRAPVLAADTTEDELQILETLREKWSYLVALAKWSISANILDQKLFLTTLIGNMEKATVSFGPNLVSSVIGMLLPILELLVPFATTMHSLTCLLANVCTSILHQDGPFAGAAAVTDTFLDDHLTVAVVDVLHGLMRASPDAFVVSKVALLSLEKISNKYPRVEIPFPFASSVKYIQGRIESLKRIETPSAISQRVLDIVLVLDRILGASHGVSLDHRNSLIENFITACPVFSRDKSSADREDSFRSLVHVICDWSTTGSLVEGDASANAVLTSLRLAVACKTLKKIQVVMQKEGHSVAVAVRDKGAGTAPRNTCVVVEASIYSWILSVHSKNTTGYNPCEFLRRSELFGALLTNRVTSLDSLTLRLIVDGTMEGAQLEKARYLIVFYSALIFRFMPSNDECTEDVALKQIRGTCIALLNSARSTLGAISGRKRKLDDGAAPSQSWAPDEILRAPPSEDDLCTEVDRLVRSCLAGLSQDEESATAEQRLFAMRTSMHPYIRWQFASQFAREAASTVERLTLLPAIGILQATGHLAPLLDFFVSIFSLSDVARTSKGISVDVLLSHMLSYGTELQTHAGAPESLMVAVEHFKRIRANEIAKQSSEPGDVKTLIEQHRKIVYAGMPPAAGDIKGTSFKDVASKAQSVGLKLAKECMDLCSAGCAAKVAMTYFGDIVKIRQPGHLDEHLQVVLLAELISQLAPRSRDMVRSVSTSAIHFCKEFVATLSDFTNENVELSHGADAISSLLLRLIAEGLIPLQDAMSVLVSFENSNIETPALRAFWMCHLMGPGLTGMLPTGKRTATWVALALDAAQGAISPAKVLNMVVPIAAAVASEGTGRKGGLWSSTALLSCLCSHGPIRKAVFLLCAGKETTFDQSLLKLVKTSCMEHSIIDNHLHEMTTLVLFEGMNNNGLQAMEIAKIDRLCHVFGSLKLDKLSLQVAELKFLYKLLGAEAEMAIRKRNQMRVVAGAKEEAIFNLNKRISESVLKASSRDPLSTVLIAEVALSFGEKLVGATLLRLQSNTVYDKNDRIIADFTSHDDQGLIMLTFLTRATGLQQPGSKAAEHPGNKTAIFAIRQLVLLSKNMDAPGNVVQHILWKQLRLLIPLLWFVLGSKFHRQELSAALLKLLSGENDSASEDMLLALCCILVHGLAPPWHLCSTRQKHVEAVPVPQLENPAKLSPLMQSRLNAGFGVTLVESAAVSPGFHGFEFDPWSLLAGGRGGKHTVAAHWLQGTVRAARSNALL